MRLAIVSDTHLGFQRGKPREGDAFDALKQAFEGIVAAKPDAIIHPGDFFDHKIPIQEVWHEAFELLGILQSAPKTDVTITHFPRGKEPYPVLFHGIPLIAIAGTHEYRSKDLKNALQVLETGHFLVCLHASHALLEKKNDAGESIEKVAIHGMSGIPEKRALEALKLYHPTPLNGHHNILVLHQSIKEFLPSKDDMTATIGMEDLPHGFDIIFNGHLHWTSHEEWDGKRLLIPGSTIFTQMKRLEGKKPKGWYMYDTQSKELQFHPLPRQRKLFYHKIKFTNAVPDHIVKSCREKIMADLSSLTSEEMLPLYRLKIGGTLAKGFTQADVDVSQITEGFTDKALFSNSKHFETGSFIFRLDELRALHKSKTSIAQMGVELLEKNVQQTPLGNRLDVARLFELLENKENVDKVVQLLQAKELITPEEEKSLPAEINSTPSTS